MKKLSFLLAAMLLFIGVASAQKQSIKPSFQPAGEREVPFVTPLRAPGDVIFSSGFEGTTGGTANSAGALPTGWTSIPASGGTAGRTRWGTSSGLVVGMDGSISPNSGTRFAYIAYNSSAVHNAWMITPAFALTAGTSYNISFYVMMEGYYGYEELEVKIGTAATAAGMTTSLWENKTTDIPSWTKITCPFTPTTSGNYYLGFWNTSFDEFYTAIDDIAVIEMVDNDLEMTAKFPYTQIPTFLTFSDFTAQVKNVGTQPQTNAVLAVTQNTAPIATSTPVTTIASGAEVTITATTTASPVTGANTLVYTVTQNETDANPGSNTATFTVTGSENTYATDGVTNEVNGVGSNTGAITFGNVFEIAAPCNMQGASIGFSATDAAKTYTVSLYAMTGATTIAPTAIYTSPQASSQTGFITVTFPETLLTPGRYFLCINQLTANNVAVTYDAHPNRFFYSKDGNSLGEISSFGAVAIRMIVAEVASTVTITTNITPAGAGTVTGGGSYALGAPVTLTATANAGYTFDKWNDNVTTNPRTFNATVDATYTAIFKLTPVPCNPVTITAAVQDDHILVSWTGEKTVNVYRNGTKIAPAHTGTSYLDQNPIEGENCYEVEVICDDEVSPKSTEACQMWNGINDIKTTFSIAPNPATNSITISATNNFHTVEVVSFLGQTILSQSSVGNITSLDVSNLTNGVYFVRIVSENGASVKKFVKQ